ncbi:2-amino-3-carboxymuconate-6-semialdehyde decarboxylase [Tolypocladium capitatum]|uniref:6-methylsalicylate decarboxylase n=1 Tax=Tolypocladium capitatum TaxID=45235 RepID=A0A2K3PYX2_9HYPO|nr:2-amino-3-carboxymuconate-6-semialdehyde decarboxylase [Tolypocladium capitatum]
MAKIDVHHHIYPPGLTAALEACGGDPSGWHTPSWTLEADNALCSSIGIGTAIFSVTAPGASILKDAEASAKLARQLNEYCAKIRDEDPSKYGFFVNVGSLLDTALCLEEIRYSFDVLQADGIILFTRYGKGHHYLGHKDFKPIWAELNRRKAVVFVHPTHPVDTNLVNVHSPLPMYDYPHETTRAAMDLIMANNLREFPDCKIVLSHAGGTLPYLIHRMTMVVDTPYRVDKTKDEIVEDAKRFYFDLALSGSHLVLDTLCKFAKPGHILFGSDFPNAPLATIEYFTRVIEEHGFDAKTRAEIYHGAGVALFPRLKGAYKS